MYLLVREYHTDVGLVDDVVRELQLSFHTMLEKVEGVVDCYATDAGEGRVLLIGLFGGPTAAADFERIADSWLKDHMGSLLPSPPETVQGEVRYAYHGPAADVLRR